MPVFIPIIAVLFGFGGVLYGADQHDQRIREQRNFRAELANVNRKLLLGELELACLSELLGQKNAQVTQLALRVEQLKALSAALQRQVA